MSPSHLVRLQRCFLLPAPIWPGSSELKIRLFLPHLCRRRTGQVLPFVCMFVCVHLSVADRCFVKLLPIIVCFSLAPKRLSFSRPCTSYLQEEPEGSRQLQEITSASLLFSEVFLIPPTLQTVRVH